MSFDLPWRITRLFLCAFSISVFYEVVYFFVLDNRFLYFYTFQDWITSGFVTIAIPAMLYIVWCGPIPFLFLGLEKIANFLSKEKEYPIKEHVLPSFLIFMSMTFLTILYLMSENLVIFLISLSVIIIGLFHAIFHKDFIKNNQNYRDFIFLFSALLFTFAFAFHRASLDAKHETLDDLYDKKVHLIRKIQNGYISQKDGVLIFTTNENQIVFSSKIQNSHILHAANIPIIDLLMGKALTNKE